MKREMIVFLAMVFSTQLAHGAASGFDGIHCETKIEAVLLGRTIPNDRVVAIEKKYKNIHLQLRWSDGIEPEGDPWTLSSWLICGREYLTLSRKNLTKDVLAAPQNLANHQFELGRCQQQGKAIPGTAVFFVATKQQAKQPDRIWTIDDNKFAFREINSGGISCEM